MKLLTLTEYCLMIFFTGVFLAVTGFTARDIGLYVGIALIYTFSHLFSKRMLERRGKEKKQVNLFQRSGHCRISAGHGIVHRRRGLVCQIKTPAVRIGQRGVFILSDAYHETGRTQTSRCRRSGFRQLSRGRSGCPLSSADCRP